MARRLCFHPLVADDLCAAIDWYEDRSEGLGLRFRALIDARFDDIARVPEIFPQAFDDADFRFGRVPPGFRTSFYFVSERRLFMCSECFIQQPIRRNGVDVPARSDA